jgi:general secretion pathway protein G
MNGKLILKLSQNRSSGFSLMELLIVLVIIGLLAAAVGPSLYKRIKPAKQTMVRDQIQSFMVALDSYFIDTGHYPTVQQGFAVLRDNARDIKNWDGPYLKKEIPNDPWGNNYVYRAPGRNGAYEIVSYGEDGVEGGDGGNQDINSWESP